MVFGKDYAETYDLLYRQKDYAEESRFVLARMRELLTDRSLHILDLGCGTGLHAIQLIRAGAHVVGVDVSSDMIALAREHLSSCPDREREQLAFVQGDVRTVRLDQQFDAVISLFHVMSYMVGLGDLEAAFRSARAHLKVGGLFLFDFWYGPAVVAAPPEARHREVEDDERRVRRTTTPEWIEERQIVNIHFDVERTDLRTGKSDRHRETHTMRYLFENEIRSKLEAAGFETVEIAEWLTGATPTDTSFGVYAVGRAC